MRLKLEREGDEIEVGRSWLRLERMRKDRRLGAIWGEFESARRLQIIRGSSATMTHLSWESECEDEKERFSIVFDSTTWSSLERGQLAQNEEGKRKPFIRMWIQRVEERRFRRPTFANQAIKTPKSERVSLLGYSLARCLYVTINQILSLRSSRKAPSEKGNG